jgi:lipopolysaccharide/colanic/teichoic acid biosynthesis glycosyltransferase
MNGVTVATAKASPPALLVEAEFTRTLCLERKRTERSRRRFVLMLLDLGPDTGTDQESLEKVLPALFESTRDTDVTGWYEDGAVLGVIFTEIGPAEGRVVINALTVRVNHALSSTLRADQIEQIHLSFHVFPEERNGQDPGNQADSPFYPDLTRERESRRPVRVLKRCMDILGSLAALILLIPVFIVIAIAVKLSSQGRVFFAQKRVGQYGRMFTFLKFRTMYTANDPTIHREYVKKLIDGLIESEPGQNGGAPSYKLTNDPRVTWVGGFLRRTSLDELPQFWNVLIGDMSLVGPRPPILYEFDAYDVWHRRRLLAVKPGLTGLWQVAGRSRVKFDDMVRLDLRYARTWTLGLDIKILLKTPAAMLSGDGAH